VKEWLKSVLNSELPIEVIPKIKLGIRFGPPCTLPQLPA